MVNMNTGSLDQYLQKLQVKDLDIKSSGKITFIDEEIILKGSGGELFLRNSADSAYKNLVTLALKATSQVFTNTVSEYNADNGVKIDNQLIKDGNAENLLSMLMVGSSNKAYMPVGEYMYSYDAGGDIGRALQLGTNGFHSNLQAGSNYRHLFRIPYPMTLGSLKLYIDNIKLTVGDVDTNNYISSLSLISELANTPTSEGNIAFNADKTTGEKEGGVGSIGALTGDYEMNGDFVYLSIITYTDTIDALAFSMPLVEMWYA